MEKSNETPVIGFDQSTGWELMRFYIICIIQQLYDFKQFHWLRNYAILENTDDVRGNRNSQRILEEIYFR